MKKITVVVLILSALFLSGCLCCGKKTQARDDLSEYLSSNIGITSFGGKVFCSYKSLGSRDSGGTTEKYLWALCQEFYLENGVLKKGAEKSAPIILDAARSVNDYKITGIRTAGESARTDSFAEVLREAELFRMEFLPALEESVLEQAEIYYKGLK
ncbi:MAG TPA: hypothetical protein DEE98_08135 [Elusimicrobia bacterium]|nr:MAG: hypothetical protein A2278_09260 [Elusimicrobia bacterium RIFOXYA12_FULL_49_49]OGS10975.1 MAG: hypothetical protein A2386_06990 [Elusimicrobia bacterium RIFOXYB1_FULL_48_9]OGS14971.1 MAG: hypothetical protein A2251_08115 [Elusimicrobia bacterium RIFOXYA2_FULL_47_53]OGS26094.1 MAG: hypothetical protein A2339_02160 [Elusimicrobia bacterium RIFOXYB12_FULL_50_12]OGS29316.1 MAG: hypothetical protein A2323_04045 [Elusimicrobia bacterium RIFOXYB2_FULL_46_23]HBU70332.1 hypothetical protein [El